MKKREWSEEQLKQLFQQLPSIKDSQTIDEIYQGIQNKNISKRKINTWIAPIIATIAAVLVIAILSPHIFQNIIPDDEIATDNASLGEQQSMENHKMMNLEEKEEKKQIVSEEKTFITRNQNADSLIVVGLTDPKGQYVIPVTIKMGKDQTRIDQLAAFNPEAYRDMLGPLTYELVASEFQLTENPREIKIEYQGEPNVSSAAGELLYQRAIIETFRWHSYEEAKLYSFSNEGIEFGNTGMLTGININSVDKKAYFLYQFNDQTKKLLVPSPNQYETIDQALKAMQEGIEGQDLKPTVLKEMTIQTQGINDQLIVEFSEDSKIENTEPFIIMLESILLTAKEFGYTVVHFKGLTIDKVGTIDLSEPVDVPFSPNPI